MPLYRDPAKPSNSYEVIKVQTCSGQPLEVTTASSSAQSGSDVLASMDWEEVSR
jgi:hypothetical protein